jgi:hypothetical protein
VEDKYVYSKRPTGTVLGWSQRSGRIAQYATIYVLRSNGKEDPADVRARKEARERAEDKAEAKKKAKEKAADRARDAREKARKAEEKKRDAAKPPAPPKPGG